MRHTATAALFCACIGSAQSKTDAAQTTNNGADGLGFVGLRPGRFAGKVCLITGATSGLGEFTAYHLARESCAVVVTGRREEKGAKVVANINAASKSEVKPAGLFIKVDVTKSAEQKAMIDKIEEVYGRLDAVFANAGVAGFGGADNTPDEEWHRIISTNLDGVFYTIRESSRLLKKEAPGKAGEGIASLGLRHGINTGGSIVLCSSIFGTGSQSGLAAYATSKHALEGLKKASADDLEDYNIRVNNINPSFTPSEMTAGIEATPVFKELIEMLQPKGTFSFQGEVAAGVAYLLSADAGYISGHSLPVDGGMIDHFIPESIWKPKVAEAFGQIAAAQAAAADNKEL